METERLTEWIHGVDERHAIPRMDLRNNGHSRCMQKLAELEDLQEQGRLVFMGEAIQLPSIKRLQGEEEK